MEFDRTRKRLRSPNRRGRGRGYRRGNNRGNYYQWRPNWYNLYNNHYAYPYPEKPPSPLPGTEEYRQRNIQQTSELIKKQLNIDSDTCNNINLNLQGELNVIEHEMPNEEETPQSSAVSEQRKPPKTKKNQQAEKEEIDVQEIYDKIIKHISNLSYSKKVNLINQRNSGYDIVIQQIQKQKQLELSKALRDMSQRPTQDTDEEVIQSIIPDIGIKLEDLPNNVIEELSKTLQVKFENDVIGVETDEDQVVDMNISPTNEELEHASNDVIDDIFDFEYLNNTESYGDTFNTPKDAPIPEEEESEFSIANIDVTKSYLKLIELPKITEDNISDKIESNCELKKSEYGTIRVKTDIFETPGKEKPSSKSSAKGKNESVDIVGTPLKTHQASTTQNNSGCDEISSISKLKQNISPAEEAITSKFETKSGRSSDSPKHLQQKSCSSPFRHASPNSGNLAQPNTSNFNVSNGNSTSTTNVLKNKSISPPLGCQSPHTSPSLAFISTANVSNENSGSTTHRRKIESPLTSFGQQSSSPHTSPFPISAKFNAINECSNSPSNFQKNENHPSHFGQHNLLTNEIETNSSQKRKDDSPFLSELNASSTSVTNHNSNSISSPKSQVISPFEHQNVQEHISPLLKNLQTPPLHSTTDVSVPKKWKSPGEKKMIPFESIEYPSEPAAIVLKQTNAPIDNFAPKLVGNECLNKDIETEKVCKNPPKESPNTETERSDISKRQSESESVTNDVQATINRSSRDRMKRKLKKNEKIKKQKQVDVCKPTAAENNCESLIVISEKSEKKVFSSDSQNSRTCKEVDVAANSESKHKHRRKREIEVQTENINELKPKEEKECKEMATMTMQKKLITVSAQTPMRFFKKNSQENYKNMEVQATECMKNVSMQTENVFEDPKEKYAAYLSHLKLMEEIDAQIKELLVKKSSLYENLALINQGINNRNNSNKKKRSKKNKNNKNCDNKTCEAINQNQVGPKRCENQGALNSAETNQGEVNTHVENASSTKIDDKTVVEENPVNNTTELESAFEDLNETVEIEQNIVCSYKSKFSNNQSKEIKDVDQKLQQPDKDKSSKQPVRQIREVESKSDHSEKIKLPKSPIKESKEADNKPLKISFKVEKDENNIKKYSLKRERSRSSSKDKEPKPKRLASQIPVDKGDETSVPIQHVDKRFKINKEIENMIYNDNKFMKKCCVKIKPLKNAEIIQETGEHESEKDYETAGEDSGSPKYQLEKESSLRNNSSETVASPHSSCSASSNSSGKQKSKVIDKLEFKGLTGSIFSLKAIDDELLAASDDGTLYFFNVTTHDLINSVNVSTQALTCLHVHKTSDECLIYATCLDGNLRVISYANKEIQKTINVEHGIQCMDISWGYVFLGSIAGELDIYNIKAGKLGDPIHIFDNRIYAIKAMQEGARRVLLMSAKDAELSVRDAMTGLLMRTVQTRYHPTIYSILSDRNLVYCGTNQHDVLVYSFQDGELVKRYEGIASRRVISMQIVDNLLFVGCFNGSVCVFHKGTHQYLGHMIRPGESLLSMLIVNNKVIVGLKNSKLVSWDVPVVYLEKNR